MKFLSLAVLGFFLAPAVLADCAKPGHGCSLGDPQKCECNGGHLVGVLICVMKRKSNSWLTLGR